MTEGDFEISWHDSGREPQCQPNPEHPDGIDVVFSGDTDLRCKVQLPYPARRCGYYYLKCRRCGIKVAVTTAGRTDDPRSASVPCQISGAAQ